MRILHATPQLRIEALELLTEYRLSIGDARKPGVFEAEIEAYLDASSAVLLLGYDGAMAVGCVAVRLLETVASACELRRLYVRPEARGMGVARTLVRAAADYARSNNATSLYLDTRSSMLSAIALYRSEGFVTIPRYNDSADVDTFMRKGLA
ncbi:MAG: GNAT family N-acetyltransferase [Candidatus Eremiobacteraeota bacterium]|nr:GNAT family N-acetyltransferase [Candidatus Eremiobacteraeota bacterium]